jgi:hypothetical protein
MRTVHLLAPVLILAACHAARSQTSLSSEAKVAAQPELKLKAIELDQKYTIEVPDDFTVRRISERGTSVPMYVFDGAESHYTIQAFVLPYFFVIPLDEKTLFRLPVGVNGGPRLTSYFKITEGRYVYYGWSVYDQAYECTMNLPCPHATPPQSRYMTQYAFAVFDKPNHSVVEFIGIHYGPSKEVTTLEGDGKLLRELIVPSLSAIRTPDQP